MPGFMRKTMSYLGLVEDYDDEYDEDEYDTRDRRRDDDTRDRRDDRDRRYADDLDDDAQDDDEWEREVAGVRSSDRTPDRAPDRALDRSLDRTPTPAEARAVLAPVASRPAPRVVERERADLSRITTVHPRTYNDARTIGEQFRDGTPVIMNLSDMDDADAKRLVDFSAGLVFGRRGSIDRVTSKVFLLSPPDVEVTAEDKARLVEKGFYNQS